MHPAISIGGMVAIALVAASFLLYPRPSRLRELADVPSFEIESRWLGGELNDLGHWLKSVFTGVGAVLLAGLTGAVFASIKDADEVLEAVKVVLWVGGVGVVAMITIWSIRFALRLRLVAERHPELGLPDNPWTTSVLLGGFGGSCLGGALWLTLGQLI